MPIIRSSRLYLRYCRVWCVMPWLLVVGCYEQSSRLCVRDEGNWCICMCRHDSYNAKRLFPYNIIKWLVISTGSALWPLWGTSIISSSWWWACKCPKHVEQIISAIKHSVASVWLSSLRYPYISIWKGCFISCLRFSVKIFRPSQYCGECTYSTTCSILYSSQLLRTPSLCRCVTQAALTGWLLYCTIKHKLN